MIKQLFFEGVKNMENIKLNESMIDKFFGGLDPDCLEQVIALVEQGAVLDPISGELVLDNTRTGICTDFNVSEGGENLK